MEKIFWELYNADSESEIEKIIEKHPLFHDNENWRPYGGNKGNFGTFESQQNHPVPALIEKITNSIDATLIKECKLIGLDPKSGDAPKSMSEAVELFYGVKNGEIGELTNTERRELAENIQVIATGDKKQPSITIFDMGEGQLPHEFKNTFLSLHQNNKASIQFVQGKYNMGSTGAVVFCGEKKYQLIASKRNNHLNNGIESEVGFTLVRRHPLSLNEDNGNFKATWYEFFSPNGKIPSFESKNLDLGLYNKEFEYGSIVKLYSYQLPRGSRGDISTDLYRDLNQYLYNLPIPLLVYEKRTHYKVQGVNKVILGNRTRIINDSKDNVEKTIDYSLNSTLGNFSIPISVTIFKQNVDHREFIKNKSIVFTQNGQVHGSESQSFVSQSLGFSLIKQHTLIHVDCTNIPTEIRQDLFMSNRTHLKQGPKTEKLLDEIISLLKDDKELKKLNNERKNSLLRDSSSDKDLLENFLSKLPVDKDVLNLLKKNGSLNFLKSKGTQFNGKNVNEKKNGKKLNRFPGVFNVNLKENKEGKLYRTIPLNSNGIVTIETDVEDDYLFRPIEKGEFQIEVLQKQNQTDKPVGPHPNPNPNVTSDVLTVNRVGPSDGTIKLLIKPNEKAKVGDLLEVRAKLTSPGKDFNCVFDVKVDEKISKPKVKEKNPTESFPNLPIPKKAYKEPDNENDTAWDNPNLNWTGEDIVKVMPETNEDGELLVEAIIINMDSYSLLNFLSKNQIKTEKEIRYIKDKYFLSIYLHSLFLFSIMQKMRKDDEHLKPIDIEEFISKMIKPYASFLLYENYHIEKFAFAE